MISRLRSWWRFRRALAHDRRQAPIASAERDVVVVPCWRRAEFLWHCLDNLSHAAGIEHATVLFRVDTGYSPDVLDVIDTFGGRLPSWRVEIAEPFPYRRTKPSANFLIGLLHASVIARRLVYLVEEDIMVARDFFRWHNAVHDAAGPLFSSIPVKNPNRKLELPERVEGYYLSSGDSSSNGACYPREIVRDQIAPYINMRYLARPKRYLRRHFPSSRVGLAFVEQDGLIRRIQEQSGLPIAWPCVPRAFHAGYYGARGGWQSFSGPATGQSLATRVEAVARTIYDAEAMRAAIDRGDFLDTCLPTNLDLPAWTALQRIEVPLPCGNG